MSIINKFKANLSHSKIQYGIWNGIPHSYVAEILGGAGFDFMVIDAEHGTFDINQIVAQLQAISKYDCSPIVRIASDDPVLMKRLLDAGVQTFIIPMVESAEQADRMGKAMRYPPNGFRGVGTALARAAQWNRVNNYFTEADDHMCLITQIESVKGVEALNDILNVDTVDVVFLGPADLAASMGYLGNPGHPEVKASVNACFEKIIASGKIAAILTSSAELIEEYAEKGATMIAVGLDTIILAKATKSLAEKYKPELGDITSNTTY
ncbi:MAG: HpcH/HpaI aldolase/citrate lyase family protein [Saprospiraceae bacterium]|nr:HpcH/HpaI aldolase/citrate lyase family protein [Bacteroidia bacterium]NNE15870.1 HpcH/HpaI aldolase/citrate lyase family protein [Saprospiraceae bacterium]NNL92117.1 HpcH/HpaI aldolase/citrate lyase family protein [Saprospiraceae bacterium]